MLGRYLHVLRPTRMEGGNDIDGSFGQKDSLTRSLHRDFNSGASSRGPTGSIMHREPLDSNNLGSISMDKDVSMWGEVQKPDSLIACAPRVVVLGKPAPPGGAIT